MGDSLIKPSNFSKKDIEENLMKTESQIKIRQKPLCPRDNKSTLELKKKKYSTINDLVNSRLNLKEDMIFPINCKRREENDKVLGKNQGSTIEKMKNFSIMSSGGLANKDCSKKSSMKTIVNGDINMYASFSNNNHSKAAKRVNRKSIDVTVPPEDFFTSLFKKLGNENKHLEVLNEKVEKVINQPKYDKKTLLTYLNKFDKNDIKYKNNEHLLNRMSDNKEKTPVFKKRKSDTRNKANLSENFTENEPLVVLIQRNLRKFKNRNNRKHLQSAEKYFEDIENKIEDLTKKKGSKYSLNIEKSDNPLGSKAFELLKQINETNSSSKIKEKDEIRNKSFKENKKLNNVINVSNNNICDVDDLVKVNNILPVLKETPKENKEKEDNSSDYKIKERPKEEENKIDEKLTENVKNLDNNQDFEVKNKELSNEKEDSQKEDKKMKKKSNFQYIDSEMKSSPQISTLNKLNEFKNDYNQNKQISQENIFYDEKVQLNANNNIDSEFFSPRLRRPEKKLFISSPKKANDGNEDKNEHSGDNQLAKTEEKETSLNKESIYVNNKESSDVNGNEKSDVNKYIISSSAK